jgi:hypothetical protein
VLIISYQARPAPRLIHLLSYKGKINWGEANDIVECYKEKDKSNDEEKDHEHGSIQRAGEGITNPKDLDFEFLNGKQIRDRVEKRLARCARDGIDRKDFLQCIRVMIHDPHKDLTYNEEIKLMELVRVSDINKTVRYRKYLRGG